MMKRGKYKIIMRCKDGKIFYRGTFLLHGGAHSLQRQINHNPKIGYCEILSPKGETFTIYPNTNALKKCSFFS